MRFSPVILPAAMMGPFDLMGVFLVLFLLVTVGAGAVLSSAVKLLVRNLLGMRWKASAGTMLKVTVVEALVMTGSFVLSFFFVAPFMSPKGAPTVLLGLALFGAAAVFHATIAVFPNLKLLQRQEIGSQSSSVSANDISKALLFSLITPCFVTLLMLVLLRSALAW